MRAQEYAPDYTLVEKDETVLSWALELMTKEMAKGIDPVCSDAKEFMERNKKKYDLIFIDIFNGRVVPDFVTASSFLRQCHDCLLPGGHAAFNYIVNNEEDWETTKRNFSEIFPGHHVISMGINRIFIS